jgi:hypothetical protein
MSWLPVVHGGVARRPISSTPPGLFNRIDHVPSCKGILSLGWPAKYGREGPINHPERNDSLGRNRILHQ